MKTVSKADARKFLADVPDYQLFWLNDGSVLKSLNELNTALTKMKADVFMHHVNKERNDFANWILDVIGDKELAQSIRKLKSKAGIKKKVAARLRVLKRKAK